MLRKGCSGGVETREKNKGEKIIIVGSTVFMNELQIKMEETY
jgi:hypothetical protein